MESQLPTTERPGRRPVRTANSDRTSLRSWTAQAVACPAHQGPRVPPANPASPVRPVPPANPASLASPRCPPARPQPFHRASNAHLVHPDPPAGPDHPETMVHEETPAGMVVLPTPARKVPLVPPASPAHLVHPAHPAAPAGMPPAAHHSPDHLDPLAMLVPLADPVPTDPEDSPAALETLDQPAPLVPQAPPAAPAPKDPVDPPDQEAVKARRVSAPSTAPWTEEFSSRTEKREGSTDPLLAHPTANCVLCADTLLTLLILKCSVACKRLAA